MKAYKFVFPEHADAVGRGSVKLSTAEELRRLEAHISARSDSAELSTSARIAGGSEVIPGDHHICQQDVFIIGGKRVFPDMTILGESFQLIGDAYLYCCSLSDKPHPNTKGQAVFEIADIEELGRRLCKRPELSFRKFEQGPVRYDDLPAAAKVVDIAPVDPFRKDPSFSWEEEYRLLWIAQPLEPTLYIEASELSELLLRVR